MKNTFEKEYAKEKEIKEAYKRAGNEEARNEARKAMREFKEAIFENGNGYGRLYEAYSDAKEQGNEYIDLDDTTQGDATKTIEELKGCGIEKFTFSSTWSGAAETAWIFTQNGCRLEGMVEINKEFTRTGKAHAYLFSIG